MKKIIPKKLKKGDKVRIIAPSLSLATVPNETKALALKRLTSLGLEVTFGKYVERNDLFNSSSISCRIEDINDAFSDKTINAVIAARGGYNSNQLLDYIDWNIVKNNPKIFCGFSDVTILTNAIFAKTGLVTYSSPNYASLGSRQYYPYTFDYIKKCLFTTSKFELFPSSVWRDDDWSTQNKNYKEIKNNGYITVNQGIAEGTIVGGNLCSFNLLQGTRYFPSLTNTILFLEEDELAKEDTLKEFDRNLQSIIQQSEFSNVKAIIIGRFQTASNVANKNLKKLLENKNEIKNIPVVINVDFGHTNPKVTFPIGGTIKLDATKNKLKITIKSY